jgi:hypothetical protein
VRRWRAVFRKTKKRSTNERKDRGERVRERQKVGLCRRADKVADTDMGLCGVQTMRLEKLGDVHFPISHRKKSP